NHHGTHGGQAGSAAQRGALHAADERHRNRIEREEHRRGGTRVGDVLLVRVIDHLRHPLHVGAGGEDGAGTGEDDGPHGTVRRHALREVRERANQLFVEGIADFGTVEGDGGDGTGGNQKGWHFRFGDLEIWGFGDYIRNTPNFASSIGALY